MRRHVLYQHPHEPRNVNRSVPPRQLGPDPAALRPPPNAPVESNLTSSSPEGTYPAGAPTLADLVAEDSSSGAAAGGEDQGTELDLLVGSGHDDTTIALGLSTFAAARAAEARQADPLAGPSPTAARPPRGRAGSDAPAEGDAILCSSVSTEAQAFYERVGDARNCEPAVARRPNSKPGLFDTPILKELQKLVQELGGSGASLADQTRIFNFLRMYDEATSPEIEPAGVLASNTGSTAANAGALAGAAARSTGASTGDSSGNAGASTGTLACKAGE